jgi:uncharacterized protein YxeA
MKKIFVIVITLIIVVIISLATNTQVNADYCDEGEIDPLTDLVCP